MLITMKGDESMNKKLIVPAMVVVIGGASILTASQVSAHGIGKSPEAKAFSEEERAAHMAEHKARMEARLTQAVTNGKITQAQKQAIIAKLAEEAAQREADKAEFQSMTPEQRRAAHEAHRAELKAWAAEQGIDLALIMPKIRIK
jgi:hypothetical protein